MAQYTGQLVCQSVYDDTDSGSTEVKLVATREGNEAFTAGEPNINLRLVVDTDLNQFVEGGVYNFSISDS